MDKWVGDERGSRSRNGSHLRALGDEGQNLTVECECGQDDCKLRLTVGTRIYRKIRREQKWRLLAVGHEVAERQRVVFRQSEFVAVDEN